MVNTTINFLLINYLNFFSKLLKNKPLMFDSSGKDVRRVYEKSQIRVFMITKYYNDVIKVRVVR